MENINYLAFIVPPIIIFIAQVYVAKHNLLFQKIQRLETVTSDLLNEIIKMNDKTINNLTQQDSAKIFYVKRSFQNLKEKHTCLLGSYHKEIDKVCKALQEIYNCISDDKIPKKKDYIHERYMTVLTNITQIL